MVRRLRLVIADNDLAALDLAVTDLTLEGHEVVATATDGDSAMAACLTARPDVVVLDHRMPPGPHGLDVAARLRVEAPVSAWCSTRTTRTGRCSRGRPRSG